MDDELMKELEVSLDREQAKQPAAESSLDEEMRKLLGDLSSGRR
jgi:hypothetical protein